MERPDLTNIDPQIRAYIESLESELALFTSVKTRRTASASTAADEDDFSSLPALIPQEEPTTQNVIVLTANGTAKRTPRHLYQRQRRGGMGIFDLETPDVEPPKILVTADVNQAILLFTNFARAFRVPVNQIVETPIRAKGQPVSEKIVLNNGEFYVAALPDIAKGGVALVSERGNVRYLRHHVFGEYMKPGTSMFDPGKFGSLVGACRTPGDSDLFIATRQGKAIRFSEKLVPPQPGPGIRLEAGDTVAGIASTNEEGCVFMVDANGKGTIRQMAGFAANKSAGGGGKIAMKTDLLVAVSAVNENDDIFMISQYSKIIRFAANEVPPKEGVVQGVNCMALRADEVAAVVLTH